MVTLLARGEITPKQFDLDLGWMSNHRNKHLGDYWSLDAAQRRAQLQAAKGGGSISPEVLATMAEFQAQGQCRVVENTEVVHLERASDTWLVTLDNGEDESYDIIWMATGTVVDVMQQPLFESLMKTHPCERHEGMACFTDNLQWREDVPVRGCWLRKTCRC